MILPRQNSGNTRANSSKFSVLETILKLHGSPIYSTSNQSNDTDYYGFNDGNLVAYAQKRMCTEKDIRKHKWGSLEVAWCNQECCDIVIRTLCDPEGKNCQTYERAENCSNESCGSYILHRPIK